MKERDKAGTADHPQADRFASRGCALDINSIGLKKKSANPLPLKGAIGHPRARRSVAVAQQSINKQETGKGNKKGGLNGLLQKDGKAAAIPSLP